jgi:hypothetical protein
MKNLKALTWTDPYAMNAANAQVFLYFVRVVDDEGYEFRYVGQTRSGKSRLAQYAQNIKRIFGGLPRRTTPGQEAYRAVHLALAKACERGWKYEFYPFEEAEPHRINEVEQRRILELQCNLNGARTWHVDQFATLSVNDLIGKDATEINKHLKSDWTGIQVAAARVALQRDAESLLGRFLFAYAQLESALDLCLVWVAEGKDLEQRKVKIESTNFSGKLALLTADAHRSTCEGTVRAYGDWVADAHTVRKRRNVLAHGRLGIDVRHNGLTVTVSRATSEKPSSVHFDLAGLQRLSAECERLIRTLNNLRTSHPL